MLTMSVTLPVASDDTMRNEAVGIYLEELRKEENISPGSRRPD